MYPSKSNLYPSSRGNLLGLLSAAFYVLFTLLPDSNTAMVEWSWVLFWQVGLLCPVLWLLGLLWQGCIRALGHHLDWLVGLLLVSVLLSIALAPFKMQAYWYGWAIAGFLAALYALNAWLVIPERRLWLLTFQGYLSLALILVSLALWTGQTLLPELSRLQEFRQYGVNLPFDFARIELRNAFPIGHQNYVAGYLILTLPLLLGLGWVRLGWQRWLWWSGAALGLVDLYTTGSRGGWLGIAVLVVVGLLLWGSRLPRRWVWLASLGGFALLITLALANNRLRSLFTGITTGAAGGELAYRLITIATGWYMGLNHWLAGGGPGAVLPLYQRYRPVWGGREAELHYQLHSTPAQLWAELGIGAVIVALGAIALLAHRSWHWRHTRPLSPVTDSCRLVGWLLSALLAYLVVSVTDYQLDNLCISGVIVIYLAVLAAEWQTMGAPAPAALGERVNVGSDGSGGRSPGQSPLRRLSLAGVALVVVVMIWLVPIHRAWMLSNQGFAALSRKDINGFVQRLNQAHQLAPWEAYYPLQLGWNLGNLSLQSQSPDQRQALTTDGIDWLKRGIQAAPYQEFGYSNLAWLLLNRNPPEASRAFAQAAQLVPAKRGGFYGLGLSLLAQGRSDLAQEAMILEVMRDPQFITSPVWRLPELRPLYGAIATQVEARYTALLATAPSGLTLANQLHQFRGGLRWWLGDLQGARADLETSGSLASRMVLNLATGKNIQSELAQAPVDESTLAIAAWVNPSQRQTLLQQAWIMANHELPPAATLQQLVETMNRSTSFDLWLKQNAPTAQFRRARIGFGILNRHADGPIPVDFMTVIDNIPITTFFHTTLLPSITYTPELDTALQVQRTQLIQALSGNESVD